MNIEQLSLGLLGENEQEESQNLVNVNLVQLPLQTSNIQDFAEFAPEQKINN